MCREPGLGLGGQTKGRRRDREGEETRQRQIELRVLESFEDSGQPSSQVEACITESAGEEGASGGRGRS